MPNNNEYMNAYMKTRYKKRRSEAICHLGGLCVNCGSDKDLNFHHENPETKMFNIAKHSSCSDELFWAEIDKCVLLCSDCHRAEHASNYPCGTPHRYWRGCRCQDCTQANTEYNQHYRRLRKEHLGSDI